MRQAIRIASAALLVGVLLALVGCSSNTTSEAVPTDSGQTFKIAEYVGDGNSGTKLPLFPLLGSPVASAVVLPEAAGTALNYGANYVTTNVYPTAINWYYLPKVSATTPVIVTMQPVHDRDADLYLLSGTGPSTGGGLACLASSIRTPSGSADDAPAGVGYAPDWAFYNFSASDWPAAHIACYGVNSGSGARYFRLEADIVQGLTVNGGLLEGSLGAGQSAWYVFATTNGLAYRVGLAALSGDPDIYVYTTNSSGFMVKNTATGGGYASFTATATASHFVRVYAFSACTYRIRVLQP